MHAKLDISWRGKQCVLAKGPKIIAKLHMSQVSSAILNLALIVTNVGAQDISNKIPTRYQAIIDKYPNAMSSYLSRLKSTLFDSIVIF